MRRAAWWSVLAVVLTLTPVPHGHGAETRILKGDYRWNQGVDGALQASFTPARAGSWEVEFRFRFQGSEHTYRGTAEGSLTQGGLSGAVKNENGRRTFTFEGTFEDGAFRGTHAETTGGRETRTGTLTLS